MSQPARAQDPSMDEIPPSIRRLTADDDATKPPPPRAENPMPPPPTPMAPLPPAPPRPVAATPPPVEPVMPHDDLESMWVDVDKGPENSDADVLDLTEAMAADMPEPAPIPPTPELQSEPAPTPRRLISSSTRAAVDSAFNTLAHT